ncbi:MAG: sensor domain-containing diguanylate cyclase [bacterium]
MYTHNDVLSHLTSLSEDITLGLKLDKFLEKILLSILEINNATVGLIAVIDKSGDKLKIKTSAGLSSHKQKSVPLGVGINGLIAKEGKTIFISDCQKDERFKASEELIDARITNLLAIPLTFNNEILGVLTIGNESNTPFSNDIPRSVSVFTSLASLYIKNENISHKMGEVSTLDEHTNLHNMRFFRRMIDREVSRAERFKTSVSVLLLNLDSFKEINDAYSYSMGNQVLKEMADLLKDSIRKMDEVGRYAGDEFILLLPQTDYHQAFFTAERLKKKIEGHKFLTKSGLNLIITASFGIASYPHHANTKDELIRQADKAVSKAKEKGKNMILIAE